MSRALVIKNADFSANKLTTVTFGDEKSCTGIVFSSDTITITGMDDVEVEYEVTPSDTTDLILWDSSDKDIVTIDDGVMTVVGVGSCEITATCGTHIASATVTVSIIVTPEFTWGSMNYSSNHAYWTADQARFNCSGDGNQAIPFHVFNYNDHSLLIFPFLIPKKTAKVKVSRAGTGVNSLFYNANSALVWFKNEDCGDVDAVGSAKRVGASTDVVNLCTTKYGEFVVPEGVDAFAMTIRCSTSYTDTPASSVASNMGLTFEYIPAEQADS